MAPLCYFLGANSSAGFYSLYRQLLPEGEAEAVFYLKGSPGCGKSTFLRRIAHRAEQAGVEPTLILCSGDPGSLDGVILPRRRIALMDATAPHALEPTYAGAVGHYVDLGACCRREGLAGAREGIMEATDRYRSHYPQAYRCLDAAARLRRNGRELLLTDDTCRRLEERAGAIIRRDIRPGEEEGKVCFRFLDAITHRGRVFLGETVTAQAGRVLTLQDSRGLGHRLLQSVLHAATAAGWDAVACPDPLEPELLRHLIIPGLSLALVTAGEGEEAVGRRIRLDGLADREQLRALRPRLRFSARVADALEEEAVAGLGRAKEAHDELEGLYHPHVDFDRVAAMADELAGELF